MSAIGGEADLFWAFLVRPGLTRSGSSTAHFGSFAAVLSAGAFVTRDPKRRCSGWPQSDDGSKPGSLHTVRSGSGVLSPRTRTIDVSGRVERMAVLKGGRV
jgi:hypothetical protein